MSVPIIYVLHNDPILAQEYHEQTKDSCTQDTCAQSEMPWCQCLKNARKVLRDHL